MAVEVERDVRCVVGYLVGWPDGVGGVGGAVQNQRDVVGERRRAEGCGLLAGGCIELEVQGSDRAERTVGAAGTSRDRFSTEAWRPCSDIVRQ